MDSVLKGRRIVLRPCCDDDLDVLYMWRNSDQFRKLCSLRRNTVTFDEFITELREDFRVDRLIQFMVFRVVDMCPCGTVYAYNLNLVDGYVFVTVYLDDSYCRMGYGAEVVSLFLSYLFSQYTLHKVYFDVYEYNAMSINTLRSAGFSEEGCFREHRMLDTYRYNLLRFAMYYRDIPRLESFIDRLRRKKGSENEITKIASSDLC